MQFKLCLNDCCILFYLHLIYWFQLGGRRLPVAQTFVLSIDCSHLFKSSWATVSTRATSSSARRRQHTLPTSRRAPRWGDFLRSTRAVVSSIARCGTKASAWLTKHDDVGSIWQLGAARQRTRFAQIECQYSASCRLQDAKWAPSVTPRVQADALLSMATRTASTRLISNKVYFVSLFNFLFCFKERLKLFFSTNLQTAFGSCRRWSSTLASISSTRHSTTNTRPTIAKCCSYSHTLKASKLNKVTTKKTKRSKSTPNTTNETHGLIRPATVQATD